MFWHLSSSCCLCDGKRSRMKTHVGLHHEHASTYMVSFRRPSDGSGVISTSTPTHKISSPSNVSARREFSFLRVSFMTFPKKATTAISLFIVSLTSISLCIHGLVSGRCGYFMYSFQCQRQRASREAAQTKRSRNQTIVALFP